MSELLGPVRFKELLLRRCPILDVRAPVEFERGHWPGAVNRPLLENDERAAVGAAYKQQGRETAVRLGHQIVSGSVREQRLQEWVSFLSAREDAVITCLRGGLRSQIAQSWCREAGVARPRIQGGYKALRGFLMQEMQAQVPDVRLTVVTGATGSGKTALLQELAPRRRFLDLEAFAHHRGSAFGARPGGQPSIPTFENRLAVALVRLQSERPSAEDPLIVEDESRLIGSCIQPEGFFLRLRESPVVRIEEDLSSRTERIFSDYILGTPLARRDPAGLEVFDHYRTALEKISSKLGGLRAAEVRADLAQAREAFETRGDLEPNRAWISKLLEWYYDPLYRRSLERRQPNLIFQGRRAEVLEFLFSRRDHAQ